VNVHELGDGAAIHLVNYDHDDDHDGVRRTGEMTLSVRLAELGHVGRVVHHPADGPPSELAVDQDGDVHRITLPDVGVYAIVELGRSAP
jgi:hypothetical protein